MNLKTIGEIILFLWNTGILTADSEGTRSLHTQGMSISTGAKWFGFMDGSNSTGFGTDQTQDVLFYVKGQVYSLYTMLGKLGMR